MTLEQIRKALTEAEYEFLRENEHLGANVVLLTLGGSHAYGTNVETSDIDLRGCALNDVNSLLGMTDDYEQVVDVATDTTIYSLNKLLPLLSACNPNTIEMLGCKPEHHLILTDIGRELLANRKMFLSLIAYQSFGGYAAQQLNRLENALARDRLPQAKKEEHILRSMERASLVFKQKYSDFKGGSIRLYTDVSENPELDREIFADIHLEHYSARQFKGIINDLSNVLGTYEKLNHRNHKKDTEHLNKHAMHLIRLYLTGIDILEKEEIITYRENERKMLLGIRHGEYQNPDGSYRSEFFDMVSEYDKRLAYAAKNTSLPEAPNMKLINEFLMDINRRSIG